MFFPIRTIRKRGTKVKTIRVEGPEGAIIDLPVPTRANRAARNAYKAVLAIVGLLGIGALLQRTNDPQAVYGGIVAILSLPALLCVEHQIRKIDWKEPRKVRRALLLAAEIMTPIVIIAAMLPSMPALLQAYGFHPSTNALAFIDIGCMFAIGLAGALINRVWTLHYLGYEK